jgi:hypothetical protein
MPGGHKIKNMKDLQIREKEDKKYDDHKEAHRDIL